MPSHTTSERKKSFIKGAIKREGALTKRVGAKPSDNISKVRKISKTGTALAKSQANFFLNVLNPANKKRKGNKK